MHSPIPPVTKGRSNEGFPLKWVEAEVCVHLDDAVAGLMRGASFFDIKRWADLAWRRSEGPNGRNSPSWLPADTSNAARRLRTDRRWQDSPPYRDLGRRRAVPRRVTFVHDT